jgi:hypothetical protein
LKRATINSEKKTFAKLFNSRQPSWIAGKRRTSHGETNILKLLRDDWRGFKAGEAIQAGHFS